MLFKNILKLSSVLFLATPGLTKVFQRDCDDLNEELVANVKKNLAEGEKIENFLPLEDCSIMKNGKIDEMSLISRRLDQSAVEKALSNKTIKKLTYFVDDDFYQHKHAVYGEFPTAINQLPELEELYLKYYQKEFYRGNYPSVEKSINAEVLNLSSKKIKTITLEHIEINSDIIIQLKELSSLQNLNVISGDDYKGNSMHDKNYDALKSLVRSIPNVTLDGVSMNSHSKYTGKCEKLNQTLMKNVKKNLRDGEKDNEFNPLRECKLDKKGRISEMYLVSERNDQSTIEKAVSQSYLKKLTYVLDNDFYQRDPAVNNDFPERITQLSDLEELYLKYNNKVSEHGESYYEEREINADILDIQTRKFNTLTLDHIKITDEVIFQLGYLRYLEKLVIISGEVKPGESTHDSNFEKIMTIRNKTNIRTLVIDGDSLDFSNYDEPTTTVEETKTTTTKTASKTSTKTSVPTSTDGKCGKKYGKCPSGYCCSKYGYCGKTSDYCGKGCQSEFGKCK